MYLLDTDHLGILQHETQPEFGRLTARIASFEPSDFFVSIISFHEQVAGWNTYVHRAREAGNTVKAYAMFEKILKDFASMQVLGFGGDAAEAFLEWRAAGVRVGTMDLRIAAIAQANLLTILTRNRRDFERIPGVIIQDWTVAGEV